MLVELLEELLRVAPHLVMKHCGIQGSGVTSASDHTPDVCGPLVNRWGLLQFRACNIGFEVYGFNLGDLTPGSTSLFQQPWISPFGRGHCRSNFGRGKMPDGGQGLRIGGKTQTWMLMLMAKNRKLR